MPNAASIWSSWAYWEWKQQGDIGRARDIYTRGIACFAILLGVDEYGERHNASLQD